MNNKFFKVALLSLPLSLAAASVQAEDYRVTVTNLTKAQYFTPILVAAHKPGHPVYMPGKGASAELEAVAEGGDTSALAAELDASDDVYDTSSSEGLLAPGESVTITVKGKKDFRYISLVSMLIPTNDAFIGISGVKVPRKSNSPLTVPVIAYDAGTEENDESCANIPGPVCGGEGLSAAHGEGFIHVHSGIHGTGDLAAETYDWNNPAASLTIERMK
jgi:hypothetical protein